ncbi:TonB-dependent receptor [Nitrospirillum pindoramense]|nr:TonB-dependent receptor [Nitrospirillum amazonense]
MMRPTSKAIALLSVSALAFTWAGLAHGQTASDTAKDDSLDEIVVVGMRKALNNAQEFKRNSEEIVDSISAVDIGALPDRSVTEALQRVPGISIGRTDEPRDIDRLNVEGSGVQIRGLTWVRSEINGRDSFGAKNGRALGWEDVTPELAAGVDVYKNPSADIVEGGLGGTINLRTRMPFDSDGQVIGLSADATNGDLRHKWTPSASGLYSNRWDTKIGEIGILVDVAHSELSSRLNALEVDPYNAHSTKTQSSYDGGTTFNFNGDNSISGQPKSVVMVPSGVEYRLEDRDRTRDGQYGALQWKPTDELEIYGTYFRSTSKLVSTDHFAQTSACCSATNNQSFLNQPAAGSGFTFDGDGNFLTGTIVDGGGGGNGVANSFLLNLGTRYGEENDETWDASGGVKWNHDRWHVNADFQRIFSRRDDYDMTVYNTVTATGGVGLDLRGDLPVIKMQNLTATPNVFNLYAAMDHNEIDKADETAGKFDTVYDVDGDFLKSLKFGFRSTDRHSIQRDGGYNWALISAPWAFTGQTATVGQFPEHQEIVNFNSFLGGSMPSLWMPSVDLAKNKTLLASYMQKLLYTPNLGSNLAAYTDGTYGYYCATCGHGTIPSWAANGGKYSPFPNGSLAGYLPIWAGAPVDANNKLLSTTQPVGSNITFWQPFNGNYNYAPTSTSGLGTNDQSEWTNAVYAQVRFGHDDLFGWNLPWDGNIGVRAVRTDSHSIGFGHVASLTQNGDTSSYSPAALQALLFANGANNITSFSNHYTDILPSLNLRFKPQDDMAIRFAAATSIVRPDFYQLSPSFTMTGTYQNRAATVADKVINTVTNQPYTQAELDKAAATGSPVMYNTGVSFAFNTGNPNLKPMRAQSFDLSYEWYLKPGSMVSFGVFDKEIYDYIQSDQTVVQVTNNGITQTVVGNVPQNHGHGRIMGLEGQVTYFYDFLPGVLSGLGTDVNFTILDSSGTQNTSGSVFDGSQIGASKLKLPLEQLSTYTLNAALLYTKYDFDFRLAYNWRSRYLMAASASNVQAPAYMEDYGQLDASLVYSINEHFKVGVQAANLLATKNVISIDERDNWYYGTQGNMSDSLIYKHNYTVADRRYSLVFRAVY